MVWFRKRVYNYLIQSQMDFNFFCLFLNLCWQKNQLRTHNRFQYTWLLGELWGNCPCTHLQWEWKWCYSISFQLAKLMNPWHEHKNKNHNRWGFLHMIKFQDPRYLDSLARNGTQIHWLLMERFRMWLDMTQ